MNRKRDRDEHLEQLWSMAEKGEDSIDTLRSALGSEFNAEVIDELASEDILELTEEQSRIRLTTKGEDCARGIIRAHRLAERLIYDILGGDFESGACEFEHTVTRELVDSICTLLGHPRSCPHGMPIPEGQCCRDSSRIAQRSVVPLVELEVGRSARIAYINSRNDQELHKLDGLRIRPGVVVTLHQRYPSYVVECEGGNIALDEEIVSSICVWRGPEDAQPGGKEAPAERGGSGRRRRFRHRKGRGWHSGEQANHKPDSSTAGG